MSGEKGPVPSKTVSLLRTTVFLSALIKQFFTRNTNKVYRVAFPVYGKAARLHSAMPTCAIFTWEFIQTNCSAVLSVPSEPTKKKEWGITIGLIIKCEITSVKLVNGPMSSVVHLCSTTKKSMLKKGFLLAWFAESTLDRGEMCRNTLEIGITCSADGMTKQKSWNYSNAKVGGTDSKNWLISEWFRDSLIYASLYYGLVIYRWVKNGLIFKLVLDLGKTIVALSHRLRQIHLKDKAGAVSRKLWNGRQNRNRNTTYEWTNVARRFYRSRDFERFGLWATQARCWSYDGLGHYSRVGRSALDNVPS